MIRARDEKGYTCLHLAVVHKHYHLCKWLLTELRILEQWKQIENDDLKKSIATTYTQSTTSNDAAILRLFEVVMKEPYS